MNHLINFPAKKEYNLSLMGNPLGKRINLCWLSIEMQGTFSFCATLGTMGSKSVIQRSGVG